MIVPNWKRYYLLRSYYSKADVDLSSCIDAVWASLKVGGPTNGPVRNLENFFVFLKEQQLEVTGIVVAIGMRLSPLLTFTSLR